MQYQIILFRKLSEITINYLDGKYSFPNDFPPLAKDFVPKILVMKSSQRLQISQIKEYPGITGWLIIIISLN